MRWLLGLRASAVCSAAAFAYLHSAFSITFWVSAVNLMLNLAKRSRRDRNHGLDQRLHVWVSVAGGLSVWGADYASLASTILYSLGEAFRAELPTEDPDRRSVLSTLYPCRAWFYRLRRFLFRRRKAAVQEGLLPLERTFRILSPEQCSPSAKLDACSSHCFNCSQQVEGDRNSSGRKRYVASNLEAPKDVIDTSKVRSSWAFPAVASKSRRGQQLLIQLPLFVSQQLWRFCMLKAHPQATLTRRYLSESESSLGNMH